MGGDQAATALTNALLTIRPPHRLFLNGTLATGLGELSVTNALKTDAEMKSN